MVNEYSTKILLKKFWKFLSEFKFEIFVAIFLTILSVNILVYAPKLVGRIVNSILNFYVLENEVQIFESFDDLIQISILYTVGYSLRIPISTIMAKISEKTIANLKSALNDKLNYLSPNTFNDEYSGNVLARLNNDVANIKSFVNKTTILFLSDVLIIIFVIFAAITMNFKLSLLFLGILPIYTIIIYAAHRKTISNYKSYQDILGKQMGILVYFYQIV
ncbi:MAG: ABC transporter ATP-binding protein [Methanobrevibacter sp.]|nr:ABC transporter ATP-binding protein [Methanobrevibacter sp.]